MLSACLAQFDRLVGTMVGERKRSMGGGSGEEEDDASHPPLKHRKTEGGKP